ncbi:uncharacterized protein [Primulina huaijiensis]|uniref:uncharacterized protein isoform X2 n=1 Tax=Primulina huaijiensis TaxID=1492673 RepID=UPI003CC79948
MSIRFKFRSSVNYETLQLDGRDSISVRELRARIIGGKSFGGVQQPQQGFDLVFADALSGQEYKGDDFQIPTGSSVIVKRVPGGAVPLSVVSPHIEAVKDLGMRDSFPLNPANESMDAFDDFGAELCPLPDSNVQHFDLEINRNNLIGNKKKEIDGLRLDSQKLDSDVTGPAVPEGNDRNLMQETRAKGHLTANKLIRSNFPVAESSNLPPEMKCALCNTIFKEAMMIPCCQHSFCENCIRLVLIEEKRCPKCFSTKYNVEDLLPNLSLRQAIERFLESQILDAGLEKTMQKDVPDGESRIEAKEDVSYALTRDIKSGLPEQKDKHLHDSRVVYSCHHDIMQRGSEPFTPVADFQGENQPVVLPQANNPGGERNFSAPGGYKKWGRNCYTCGSPDHLMRDCPMSYPSPMFHPGDRSFQGGMPGYAAPYWNGPTLHHFRPFANMYTSPAMMPFNTPMVPASPFAIHPYFSSMHGGLSGPGGNMMMGNMGPPHNAEYFRLQYSENRRKHSNENLRREPLSDDEDGFPEVYQSKSPEKSHNYKAKNVRESSLSHSGESYTRRAGGRIKHEKYEESDINRHENRSHSSLPGIEKRPHSDNKSNLVKDDVFRSSDRHSGGRHRHHHGEPEKHHERRGFCDSDSSLGHHSIQKGVKRRVGYDDVRGSHKKHRDSYLESSFERRSPDDPRRGCKKRDAGHYYRDSRHVEKISRDKKHGRRQTTSVSDEDHKNEHRYHRRK